MSARYTTNGNARFWEVAKGYRYTTRQDLPLVRLRPEGEPSLLAGTCIVIAFMGMMWVIAKVLP